MSDNDAYPCEQCGLETVSGDLRAGVCSRCVREPHCPVHHRKMALKFTSYGERFQCDEPGCTMVCWGGPTSKPADADTRNLRQQCHDLFDPLWQEKKFNSRNAAYKWLADQLGLSRVECHIGMFDKETCELMIERLTSAVI